MKLSIEDKLAILLITTGAALRFYNFNEWSLSNDELSALTRLKYDTYGEMIEKGVRTNDMHPIGVQSFLWMWTHLFGNSVTAVRLPFVIFGIFSIPLFYLTGRNFFGKPAAVMATAVFSALQFPILYAQLARPYSPGLFFSLLTVYAWSNIVWKDVEWKWKNGLLFIVGGVGCMYSHYFSFMFAGIVGLFGFFYLKKAAWKYYIGCGIAMMVLYIPNGNVFISQFSIGGLGGPEGWLGPPEKDALWKYILFCLNDSIGLFFFLFSAAVVIFLRYKNQSSRTTRHIAAFAFFALPALIAYFYSVFVNPVFQYSILLFSFPFLILWMFSWFTPVSFKAKEYLLIVVVFLATVFSTVVANGFYSWQFFAPFSNVAERCARYTAKYRDENPVATVNVIHPDYILYYSESLKPKVQFKQFICNRPEHFLELKKIVAETEADCFIHAWSNNYHAPETEMIIEEVFPYLIEKDSFFNAGVLVYSKDSTLNRVTRPVSLYEVHSGFEDNNWTSDSLFKTDSISFSGKFCMQLNEAMEFSPGIKDRAENIGCRKGSTFQLKCRYFSLDTLTELKAVISIDRNGTSLIWRGYNLSLYPSKKGEWTTFYSGYKFQEEILPDDIVSVYFYNPAKEQVWIDDIGFKMLP
jgi:hypothetical protein